ncbi:MAG: hypothetical protein H6847_12085 [Hyphomonas sp.]|nr:hypothetical protein [Hyphomonas sp.]MCA8904812.1 hypothetical protein [Hyphomonas sp.]MCB9972240.1 hypothetical protein [Hyphomonas sp.]
MPRSALPILFACLIGLVLVLTLAPRFWLGGGVGSITWHGWIAYVLGGAVTLALSGGLFFLSFHSSRSGFDDIDRPEDHSE